MPDGTEQSVRSRSEPFRVGEWLVEPALNQLSAAGKTSKLEPKAMAVLCYLAQRPGQVVSREALLSAIWPGVVVGDDSLTQAVIKLRKALCDVAESPAYIQTIPKGGYRLVAKVSAPDQAVGPAEPRQVDTTAKQLRSPRRWLAPVGALAVVLIAGATWWVVIQGGTSVPAADAALETESARQATQPTVSVQPFEAVGGDPQAVVLARGVTADLVTDLLKVYGLSVIAARPMSASAAGQNVSSAAPARYIVTGSVQRFDDRLRLHVHLTDAESGQQLWSERYDRKLSDLFTVQEELGRNILQLLPAKVSEAELRRLAQHHTRNLLAYEYFQRGQIALIVRQQADNELAREMFQRAIELDGSFARAHAGLALTYAADYRNQWASNGGAALERAFELARTGHQIDPDVRETYWVLAFVHLERRQHKEALQQLETVIRLYPSFADAYALMAGINAYIGQPANSLPLMRTAMRLHPEAGYLYLLILGRAYFGLQDFGQARVNLERALLRNPANLETRVYAAAVHLALGNKAAAAWEAEEIRALQPEFSSRAWLATHPLTDAKTRQRLTAALVELGF